MALSSEQIGDHLAAVGRIALQHALSGIGVQIQGLQREIAKQQRARTVVPASVLCRVWPGAASREGA